MTFMLDLPKDTKTLVTFSDLHLYHATIERDEKGFIYFVAWAWGVSTVLAIIEPNGKTEVRENA